MGCDDRLCAIIEPCLAPRIRRFIVIEIQGTRIRAGRRDCPIGKNKGHRAEFGRGELIAQIDLEIVELGNIEFAADQIRRSEEHTSELQSLMRISYAVFCLKKKNKNIHQDIDYTNTSHIDTKK